MARPRKPADGAEKILSRRVLVVIDRDMTDKTPRVVWQHEIPVLESVHGAGKVIEVDAAKLNEGHTDWIKRQRTDANTYPSIGGTQDAVPLPSAASGVGEVFIGDPATEYERLETAYGRQIDEDGKKGDPHVQIAYGRFHEGRFADLLGEPELTDLPDWQLVKVIRGQGQAVPPEASREELLKLAEEAAVELA